MFSKIPDTDLILNDDRSVYHLCIKPEDLADIVIIFGNPNHLNHVTQHFSESLFSGNNREFISRTGLVQGRKITVLSTGVGTSKADIVMNELDAVQNVNFLTREKLQNSKSIIIIGIRETNTIQADLSPGEMFLTSDVIGLDNLMNFYSGTQAINDTELKQAFENQIKLAMENIKPYCLKASENLKSIFVKHFIEGITVTAPGFYGPQGRVLRIPLSTNKFMEQLKLFRYEGLRILNVDMDTSAYYAFGALMGHEVITINTVVQNTSNFENDNEVNSVIGKAVDIVLQEVLSL